MKILTVVLSLALISVCSTAVAQWQWLDKDGRKVFSDRAPPADVMEKDILKRPNGTAKAPAAPESNRMDSAAPADAAAARIAPLPSGIDKDLEAKKKLAADAENAKRKADEDRNARARADNCTRARQGVAGFDSGIRIARTNAAGEREVLDDSGRAAERKRLQGIVDSDCK